MPTRSRLALMALVMALTAGCDQATKRLAIQELRSAPPRSYLGDLFRLQYSENPGAFLSLGAGLSEGARSWIFVGGVAVILTGLLLYALLSKRISLLGIIGVAFLAGGGFSNWADRLLRGNVVVDFMNVGIGPVRSGIFNVADLFLEAGAVMLVVSMLRSKPSAPALAPPPRVDPGPGMVGPIEEER